MSLDRIEKAERDPYTDVAHQATRQAVAAYAEDKYATRNRAAESRFDSTHSRVLLRVVLYLSHHVQCANNLLYCWLNRAKDAT